MRYALILITLICAYVLGDTAYNNIKEVTTERPVLNVRYLNTFRNEYWSIKEVNKLNSTYIPFIIFLLKS